MSEYIYDIDSEMARELLCKLLDERGVEYKRHYLHTLWYIGTKLYMATDNTDGTLIVDNLTPEQAIAATLNSRAERTCRQEERGWGTEGDHARVWLTCGHDCMVPTVNDLPNYCPHCGAKVVGE